MFLHELTHEQRRAFLVLARQVVDADHRLAIQEVERLDRLYVAAGVQAETAGAPTATGNLHLLFGTERSRVVLLIELLLVAYADGRFHPSELEAIRRIATQVRLDAGVFHAAMDWARRLQALVEEASELGSAVGTP
ncbi:MAG: TerB family tellurite resistance protein [Bacteroidota bacterium]